MSKFSRVKKNVDLYNKIIEEDKTKIIESSLRDYERRTTDPHSKESTYQASRYRKNKDLIEELSEEKFEGVINPTDSVLNEPSSGDTLSKKEILRDRDLLEEFIQEVKHYNINRGLRNVQDTQMNILQTLSKAPQSREEPSQKEEATQQTDKSDLELTHEIQAIIKELDEKNLDSDYDEEGVDDFTFSPLESKKEKELSNIFSEIEDNSKFTQKSKKAVFKGEDDYLEDIEENKDQILADADSKLELAKDETSLNKRDFKSSELLELTQTLNLKLDLQEAELEDVSEKVTVLDRILTGFLVILIIALIIIIAYGVFWVYRERGGF